MICLYIYIPVPQKNVVSCCMFTVCNIYISNFCLLLIYIINQILDLLLLKEKANICNHECWYYNAHAQTHRERERENNIYTNQYNIYQSIYISIYLYINKSIQKYNNGYIYNLTSIAIARLEYHSEWMYICIINLQNCTPHCQIAIKKGLRNLIGRYTW